MVFAILASLIWHVFWLTAVKVIIIPNKVEPVKFSKVSFLGPILAKGTIEVKVAQKRSPLEKRYLLTIADSQFPREENMQKDLRAVSGDRVLGNEKLNLFVDEAVSGQKLEPNPVLE